VKETYLRNLMIYLNKTYENKKYKSGDTKVIKVITKKEKSFCWASPLEAVCGHHTIC
jgi:hypothetical protein